MRRPSNPVNVTIDPRSPARGPPAAPRLRRVRHRCRAPVTEPDRRRVASLASLAAWRKRASTPASTGSERYSAARAIPGRPLLIGSHTDTQPRGGWLDGALGVIYGLEAARALAECDETRHLAVDVASWIDEEGAFSTCLGSLAFCGELAADGRGPRLDQRRGEVARRRPSRGRARRGSGRAVRARPIRRLRRGAHRAGAVAGASGQTNRSGYRHRRLAQLHGRVRGPAEPRRHDPDGAPARRGARPRRARPPGLRDLSGAGGRTERVGPSDGLPSTPASKASCRGEPRCTSSSATRDEAILDRLEEHARALVGESNARGRAEARMTEVGKRSIPAAMDGRLREHIERGRRTPRPGRLDLDAERRHP